ncbi:uncharacterized protein [Drosophila takahashii]|uniref:uncharacterized protein n=1 Tax=Drosophila takahashii TaxID=29030 RepID=UPI0038993C11
MEEILKKLNSEELFDCFQDHGIDEDSVLLLSPDHLREIVPKKLYGARVKFEHNRSLRMKLQEKGLVIRLRRFPPFPFFKSRSCLRESTISTAQTSPWNSGKERPYVASFAIFWLITK